MVYVPDWFFAANSALELVATIACFLIFFAGYKFSRFSKENKYYFFGLAFFFLGISFLARTMVHLSFFKFSKTPVVMYVANLFNYGSSVYMALTLAAYLILLTVSMEIGGRKTTVLLFLISFGGIFFSAQPLKVFHIIAIIVLGYILWHYLNNYLKKAKFTSLLTFLSFLLILSGHVMFILLLYDLYAAYTIYIVGHVLQLMGYGALLFAIGNLLLK
jgi:hypothetical protein